jgi:hypothetical protein
MGILIFLLYVSLRFLDSVEKNEKERKYEGTKMRKHGDAKEGRGGGKGAKEAV